MSNHVKSTHVYCLGPQLPKSSLGAPGFFSATPRPRHKPSRQVAAKGLSQGKSPGFFAEFDIKDEIPGWWVYGDLQGGAPVRERVQLVYKYYFTFGFMGVISIVNGDYKITH